MMQKMKLPAKPITLRNLPPEIARAIQKRAREQGLSLNRAVIAMLEESLGLRPNGRKRARYHDLDSLFGTWTPREANDFDAALAEQRRIDSELWP